MIQGITLVVYPVKDIAQAKALYSKLLDAEPYFESPYYTGFRVGDLEIGLDPNGHKKGWTGPLHYWQTDDIEKRLQSLVDAGAEVHQGVQDVGDGNLIASVRDVDGNLTGLLQLP